MSLCWLNSVSAQTPSVAALPLRLSWAVEQSASENRKNEEYTRAVLTLRPTGQTALPAQGWTLYFNCLADVETGPLEGGFTLERVVGTLFRVRPGPGSAGVAAGGTLQIHIVHPEVLVNESKAPAGPYLVFEDQPEVARALAGYDLTTPPASAGVVTPQEIYRRNAAIVALPAQSRPPVLPTPREFERHQGTLHWSARPLIVAPAALHAEAAMARSLLARLLPASATDTNIPALRLAIARLAQQISAEAYELKIDPRAGVQITGNTAAGVARGLASLGALLPPRALATHTVDLPALSISDAPRFPYRGLMLDVARNFQSKSTVLRLLDLMARFKLNTLHLHLCDDEGWRLEIAGLPELTAVGARRGHSSDPWRELPPAYGSGPEAADAYGSGYYTRAQYLEILRYAAARHIEVIPEFEMPGHARAAVVSMTSRVRRLAAAGMANAGRYQLADPEDQSAYLSAQRYRDNVMNPALPSTYAFIEQVVTQIVALHREAGVPLHTLHVGGDELPGGSWERSPACLALMKREKIADQAGLWNYFYMRVDAILKRHGLQAAGWEELGALRIAGQGASRLAPNPVFTDHGFTLYVWRNIEGAEDLAYQLANAGYDTVLTPATRLYFDMVHYPSPEEPGQNWAGYADLDRVFDFDPYNDIRQGVDDATPAPGKQQLSEAGKRHIRGIEGTLFSETVREPARLEYLLMPRLLALAERAWAPEPSWALTTDRAQAARLHAAAWSQFVSQIGLQVLPALDAADQPIGYRIPPPGLAVVDGAVMANEQLPGFVLRYSVDGSAPNVRSPLVVGPIRSSGAVEVSAFDRNGRHSRPSRIEIH